MIQEQSITLPLANSPRVVMASMDVFYNPVMQSNRNISISLLKALPKQQMKLALPLAGSGIRGLRFLKELNQTKIAVLAMNDHNPTFIAQVKKSVKCNGLDSKKIVTGNEDANLFLLRHEGFDYIDLDPFGSPNPFLPAALARLSRGGILAITATDTAALSGTYPKSTQRKYWAKNTRTPWMHEMGLRILIRKVQLQGVQFEKAMTPLLSYHKDHYFRVYLQCEKGKKKCDELLAHHKYFLYNPKTLQFLTSTKNSKKDYQVLGPLWAGKLQSKLLLTKMITANKYTEDTKFLEMLHDELDCVGYYDLHALAKRYATESPSMQAALKLGTRTHFSLQGIKSNKSFASIKQLFSREGSN